MSTMQETTSISNETVKFHKFHSIENSYRKKHIEYLKQHECTDKNIPWCVLEKVHGANFSATVSVEEDTGKKIILWGKRKSFLLTEKDKKAFYNCGDVIQNLEEKISRIFDECKELFYEINVVRVYGEYMGGFYNNLKTENGKQYAMVQKGVEYCPDHQFYAFDLMIDDRYIDYWTATELFSNVGLLHAPIIFEGSFDECLKWSREHNTDNSIVPTLMDLPELKENIREGNVIKPIVPAYTHKGDFIILKDKNEKFKEKASKNKNSIPIVHSENLQKLLVEGLLYVTEQRLTNVLSKDGVTEIEKKKFGYYLGLFTKDVLEEFLRDNSLDSLEGKEQKIFRKEISNVCAKIMRKNM